MTTAIIQIIIGLLLLAEVSGRIFGWTYPTDFTYRICRPFWIPFPMIIGIIILELFTAGAFLIPEGTYITAPFILSGTTHIVFAIIPAPNEPPKRHMDS